MQKSQKKKNFNYNCFWAKLLYFILLAIYLVSKYYLQKPLAIFTFFKNAFKLKFKTIDKTLRPIGSLFFKEKNNNNNCVTDNFLNIFINLQIYFIAWNTWNTFIVKC